MNNNEKIEQHLLDKYTLLKKLGSGAYGHVWKVKSKKDGKFYALKKIFDAFQHSTDAQRTFREISVLKKLKYEKIIGLHDVIPAKNNEDIYLVFDYMESDLYHLIYEGKLEPIHIKYIAYQLLIGLNFMHASHLIHRDLKPSNLLLNSDCSMKICDFGLVRYIGTHNTNDNILTQGVATRWYRAPEVLLGSNSYGIKADIWSVGCIIAEMIIKNPLFPGNCTTNQLQKILKFTGQPSSTDISSIQAQLADMMINQVHGGKIRKMDFFSSHKLEHKDAIDLIDLMLQFNPQKRPTAEEALRHPYFKQFLTENDLIVKKQPIFMQVDENIKLGKQQYLSIIKEKFIEQQKRQTQFSRDKMNNSPKRFSDLKKSRNKSISKSFDKISKDSSSKNTKAMNHTTSLFKQLCQSRQKDDKKRKIPGESGSISKITSSKNIGISNNKENRLADNRNKQKTETMKSPKNQNTTMNFLNGNSKKQTNSFTNVGDKKDQKAPRASFTGLRKISKLQKN